MRDIFQPRVQYKPFEYPEVLEIVDAINKTFWVHSEVNFTADTQDYATKLTPHEQQVIKRALLVIAQTEVSVKAFWGNLYNILPKPELNGLGVTIGEDEFRHSEAYARLLEVLGLNSEFNNLLEVPAVAQRVELLEIARKKSNSLEDRKLNFLVSTIVFSVQIENVSLFSQFAILLSFTRFRGLMKNVSNMIAWTSLDEQLHAKAGIYLVKEILKENPELKERAMVLVKDTLQHLMEAEIPVLDWIHESGDLEEFSRSDLYSFMQDRANKSLVEMGFSSIFSVDPKSVAKLNWFDEEINSVTLDDFFAKRPVDYTKHQKTYNSDSLF